MKRFSKYCLFIFLALYSSFSFSQNNKVDSVLNVLKIAKEDTNKANTLNILGRDLMYKNTDSSMRLARQALALSQKLKWKKGIADSYSNIGVYYWLGGDYASALSYHLKGLKGREELGDKKRISASLGNIGIVYWSQENLGKALEYFFSALKISEEIGDKQLIGTWLGNIGNVYQKQADEPEGGYNEADKLYEKALEFYLKALKLAEELDDAGKTGTWTGNIGLVYQSRGESSGNMRKKKEFFGKAINFYFKALYLSEKAGDENGSARHLANIGSLFIKQKNYLQARTYLNKSLTLTKEAGYKDAEKEIYAYLSSLDSAEGNWRGAYENHKLYSQMKDTLLNDENSKQITEMQAKYDTEKKDKELIKKDAEITKQNAESAQRATERNAFIIGFALMIALAFFIFRSYRQKQKANVEISRQKEIIEEKQKDILDSIYYARRIQQSLLPTEKYIERNLKRLMKN